MDPAKAWQVVPDGQAGASSEQMGRQTPAPVVVPDGTTQLRPAAQPAQVAVVPSQPWFWVQADPRAPRPGQAQSVVSSE